MKKTTYLLSLLLIGVITVCSLVGCGGTREKFDFSSVSTLADLKGAKIGAQSGTFHLKALKEQTTGVEVTELPDFTQLLVALNSGAIDGYVAEEPTALSMIVQNEGLTYLPLKNNVTGFRASNSDTGVAIAFAEGSPLTATVNGILSDINGQTRDALMRQAVTMSIDKDAALSEEPALTLNGTTGKNGTLKVAMECAYDPFNWTQTTDVNGAVKIEDTNLYANGYDVQIAAYVAEKLDMELKIYAVKWESLIAGVNSGYYDAIIAGMSPTEDREREVDFTECYYESNLVIIYKKQ